MHHHTYPVSSLSENTPDFSYSDFRDFVQYLNPPSAHLFNPNLNAVMTNFLIDSIYAEKGLNLMPQYFTLL